MTLKKTLVLAAAALVTAAGMANAQVTRTASQSGPWNDNATWGNQSYPVAGDTAIVNNAYTITVDDDAAAAVVQISNGGVLQVEADKFLTIESGYFNSPAVSHQIDGYLVLEDGLVEIDAGSINVDAGGKFIMQGNSPRLQIDTPNGMLLPDQFSSIEIVTDAAIGGSNGGSILCSHADASVVINTGNTDDVELTLEDGVTVRGQLTFMANPNVGGGGKGRLYNDGMIKADAGTGTRLLLDASLFAITDGGGTCAAPNWYADTSSNLRFEKSATSLTSAFRVDGTLSISSVTVTTSGKLNLGGSGTVPSAGSPGFNHSGACP